MCSSLNLWLWVSPFRCSSPLLAILPATKIRSLLQRPSFPRLTHPLTERPSSRPMSRRLAASRLTFSMSRRTKRPARPGLDQWLSKPQRRTLTACTADMTPAQHPAPPQILPCTPAATASATDKHPPYPWKKSARSRSAQALVAVARGCLKEKIPASSLLA
ncbi:uncharacterized protein J3D65DRAFT_322134 [Phyllosticta citribraziliensis]|uniref:Uncharacterized protein n=1 Tax=Phyllosticta citribraziliensis TaxID=989973 RepID=A0ABR1LSW0_9PEZI